MILSTSTRQLGILSWPSASQALEVELLQQNLGLLQRQLLLSCHQPLDQGDPASPELSASPGFVVALCFAIPGGPAFPAGIATAVMPALFQLQQKTLRVQRRSLAHPPTVLSSASQETRGAAPRGPSRKPCAHEPSASPDAVEPCPVENLPESLLPLLGRSRRRSIEDLLLERGSGAPHTGPPPLDAAHCARTGTVGASTHLKNDKRPSQRPLEWTPKTNPSPHETAFVLDVV